MAYRLPARFDRDEPIRDGEGDFVSAGGELADVALADETIAVSRSERGRADSRTAFGWLLRRILVASIARAERNETVFKDLASSPDTVRLMIRQSHCVTRRCDQILRLAAQGFDDLHDDIEAFRRQELGHDELVARSAEMTGAIESPVLIETQNLLDLLEKSAGRNLLAFCLGIAALEGIDYDMEHSPYAAVVRSAFGEAAAEPLQRHDEINRTLAHGQVALQLLKNAPCMSEDQVRGASLFTAHWIRLQDAISEKLARSIQRAHS